MLTLAKKATVHSDRCRDRALGDPYDIDLSVDNYVLVIAPMLSRSSFPLSGPGISDPICEYKIWGSLRRGKT